MKKIVIIGTTGSGKSTLAKGIARKLDINYIQLDQLFWLPNWGESSDEDFYQKISQEIAANAWVVDGNYTRSQFLTWKEADSVIWIDLPFWLTFYQNFTRSFKRALFRVELWPNTGNRESFFRMFSRDSILLWLIKTYKGNIEKYESKMQDPQFAHIKFYRLRSRKEVNQFLDRLT